VRIAAFFAALAAAARLALIGARAASRGEGPLKDRLKAALAPASSQMLAFAVLRVFVPNLILKSKFITAWLGHDRSKTGARSAGLQSAPAAA
jgi:hypothetical protein